jgi:hypothetical protein
MGEIANDWIRYRQILIAIALLVVQISAWNNLMGEGEHKSVPCTLFDRGSSGAVVEFSGVVESDGVHSVIIVPEACPTVALNLLVDPSMKRTSWWKRFRSVLSSGHPGTVDKKVTALFQGVIVRSVNPSRLDIEVHRISEIKTLPRR